jgi:hypothetical protein
MRADDRGGVLELFLGLIFLLSLVSISHGEQPEFYSSPDHTLKAKVSFIGETQESRVEIFGRDGKLRSKRDYTSKDGSQGRVVEYAGWTADSKFFVFSAVSSGGHEPMQSPTFFYYREDNTIHDFYEYLPPVAEPSFVLKAPDWITLVIWTPFRKGITDSVMLPITFKISDLMKRY